MMRWLALLLLAFALTLPATWARAQDGDSATLAVTEAIVGQQVILTIEVVTDPDATVELDPSAESWGDVEVLGIQSQQQFPEGERPRHVIVVRIAPFNLGTVAFEPVVNIVTAAESQPRALPPQQLTVLSTLAPDGPLELSPLPGPVAISGAESPFLRPLIGLGAALALLLLGALAYGAVVLIRRRPRAQPVADAPGPPVPDLSGAATLLESDPVTAYRVLSAAVRRHITDQYGFPAVALTARELERRMEAEGVDRWQARLVGGLLENCDSVVYAGYRPATERRQADLTMAREIVEAT